MMKAEEVKAVLTLPQSDDSSLLRLHLQMQALHHDSQSPQAFLGRCLTPAEDDEVVRIPHQHPQVPTSLLPHAIEFMQDDVG